MRFLIIGLALILLTAFDEKTAPKRWVVMSGCALKVDGNTNINSFSCSISNYSNPDTIVVSNTSGPVSLRGLIRLNVENFDCHNPIMTSDLRKTLKSKEFPYLIIRFISLNKYPDESSKKELTKGTVIIELAGVSRQFDIDYKIVEADNNTISMVGFRRINFTDFNLVPPRKLGGMIKTNNELSVAFNLRVKVL